MPTTSEVVLDIPMLNNQATGNFVSITKYQMAKCCHNDSPLSLVAGNIVSKRVAWAASRLVRKRAGFTLGGTVQLLNRERKNA
jgi:hypothetical protein